MPNPTVQTTLRDPAGVALAGAIWRVELVASDDGSPAAGYVSGSPDHQLVSSADAVADATGAVSLALTPNALISPANTYYRGTVIPPSGMRPEPATFQVPDGAGPYDLGDILHAPSTIPAPGAATPAQLTAHADDTTAIHGIADTSLLETTDGATTKADAAQAAAEATAATALATHDAATTSIHGIVDTANLALITNARADNADLRLVTVNQDSPHGPFAWTIFDDEFNGTLDPVSLLGYNAGASGSSILAGEPSLSFVIEGDYDEAGTHWMEAYYQYRSADNVINVRPYFVQVNRSTHVANLTMNMNGGQISFDSDTTQVGVFTPTALSLRASKILTWPDAGTRLLMTARNQGDTATGVVLQITAANELTFGDANFSAIRFGTTGKIIGPTTAAFNLALDLAAGQNADGAGGRVDLRYGLGTGAGLRLLGGRWSGADRGGRLVALNSGGTEKSYLALGGDTDYWALGSAYVAATGTGTERIRGNATGLGFFGATPVAKPTLAANASDLATAITLVNDIKARLVAYGLAA